MMVRTAHPGSPRRRCDRVLIGLCLLAAVVAGATGPWVVTARSATPAIADPVAERPAPALPPRESGVTPQAAKPAGPSVPLSPLGMFLGADPVVQGVMMLLALSSVATWTVLLVRTLALLLAKARLRRAIRLIRDAPTLPAAGEALSDGLAAHLIAAAEEEVARSPGLTPEGIKDRAGATLARIETAAAKRAAAGTGLVATIGSAGPFVGLFGTVWGIMHSFVGIAESHTTNLAVVAPGIAEALLATGIGLVAAIPAVVIYNVLVRSATAYRALIGDAATLILNHLSRDLDRPPVKADASYRSAIPAGAE